MERRTAWEWAQAEGLLNPDADPSLRGASLLQLCDAGALEGGLTVALDVRPDELIGALCARLGGSARSLHVLDVRDRPKPLMVVQLAGREERWPIPDNAALIKKLNAALRSDPAARVAVELGEWEEALQIWCVPKPKLAAVKALQSQGNG